MSTASSDSKRLETPGTPVLSVSAFVALTNQVLDVAFPEVILVGELANFKVSKNRWVYFDLKDDEASVRCFGTVYMLPGPLEDGMILEVRGTPRLHTQFGFSINVQAMRPVGEGAIRKAAELLRIKLTAEGLFDEDRKRSLPYPPQHVGLITSGQSAAYADFIKIMNARWHGVHIDLADVQVQGEQAPAQIVRALRWFNEQADPLDVLVVVRGGGSADDLAAFSAESVVRAVAGSRVPTMVAIGHEVDLSLAELAADQRASTPSNAAELLVPDRREVLSRLQQERERLGDDMLARIDDLRLQLSDEADDATQSIERLMREQQTLLRASRSLAEVLSPARVLERGYAIVRRHGSAVRGGLHESDIVDITLSETVVKAKIVTDATEEVKHA
jgi:exodeoxyribonuclease VII large subunit